MGLTNLNGSPLCLIGCNHLTWFPFIRSKHSLTQKEKKHEKKGFLLI